MKSQYLILFMVAGLVAGCSVAGEKSSAGGQSDKELAEELLSQGFVQVFNGRDLSGWKGLVGGNPAKRDKMGPEELAQAQAKAFPRLPVGTM